MTSNKNHITVVGSSNTDLVVECGHLPTPGETVLGGPLQRHAGGKGANQAVAAARAVAKDSAMPVSFVGARGDDEFGQMAQKALAQEGIDLSHFSVVPGISSGVALILLDGATRENSIVVAKSANDMLNGEHISAAKVLFGESAVVLCQLESPLETVLAAARLAREAGAAFMLNPAPAQALPEELLALTSIITPNQDEALSLTNAANIKEAAQKLHDKGCAKVAITLGKDGALLLDEHGFRQIPAPAVKVVDTTGAGDCFNGSLAVKLAQGLSFDEAAIYAVAAAAENVTKAGARGG